MYKRRGARLKLKAKNTVIKKIPSLLSDWISSFQLFYFFKEIENYEEIK
jgi:hypothetical protein